MFVSDSRDLRLLNARNDARHFSYTSELEIFKNTLYHFNFTLCSPTQILIRQIFIAQGGEHWIQLIYTLQTKYFLLRCANIKGHNDFLINLHFASIAQNDALLNGITTVKFYFITLFCTPKLDSWPLFFHKLLLEAANPQKGRI